VSSRAREGRPGRGAAGVLRVAAAAALVALAGFAAAAASPDPEAKARRDRFQSRFLGQPAPDFALVDLKGKTVRLKDLRGKVVLLNFWYSACLPCRKETPDLITLHRLHADQGLALLGINLDDIIIPDAGGKELLRFLKEFGVPYPVLLSDLKTFEAYGEIPVQPISFLVDRQGKVARVFWGAYPGPVFERAIAPYLGASPSRP
jgi:cytochrome c biogenesis protein CcmG/thiol:disulfide interchange protein DsbE